MISLFIFLVLQGDPQDPPVDEAQRLCLQSVCTLEGDFNADGLKDQAWLELLDKTQLLIIKLDGSERTSFRELSSSGEITKVQVSSWRVLKAKDDHTVDVNILGRTVAVSPPGLTGDALWITGTDAAELFYMQGESWTLWPLGY